MKTRFFAEVLLLATVCGCTQILPGNPVTHSFDPSSRHVHVTGMVSDAQRAIQNPPDARSPLTLLAINDPRTGLASFGFKGGEDPPVIRAEPGNIIRITYINEMSKNSKEQCVDGPCRNMTNLHFHGLHVSPNSPQDDVISMMAMPGESLEYAVDIPLDQPPGLYWYHTHPHGESYQQSLDGMSGAIVIEGIGRYFPEVDQMLERILILRDRVLDNGSPASSELKDRVKIPSSKCGHASGEPERLFTVNGAIRPRIAIGPSERQFWRIVNASPDLYADLRLDATNFEVVALDGMPVNFHDPGHKAEVMDHVLLPPAGRVEAIVTGHTKGNVSLRSLCFDTGPDGDPNPEMVLADLVNLPQPPTRPAPPSVDEREPVYRMLSKQTLHKLEGRSKQFTATFTEDKNGFYINGKKYGPKDGPMISVKIGEFHHWRVVNNTREVHPFHIHQVHFLVYEQNGRPAGDPHWLDTINVPPRGSVDMIMDFTDPIIRGMSVFHCHLLKHEDKGMMAKILFQ
jgi:suppressor of ftsI